MTDLSTTYLGLELKNPLVASASPLSKKVENARKLEEAGVSAIVTVGDLLVMAPAALLSPPLGSVEPPLGVLSSHAIRLKPMAARAGKVSRSQ